MNKLIIGIFGDTPIIDKDKVRAIITEYIDAWIARQSEEVRSSHIEVVGISETKGVVEIARALAIDRGFSMFTFPLNASRYKGPVALWMRNAAILERINHLLIIRKPKRPVEYLSRLETRARENKIPIVTAFLNPDESFSTWSR